MDTNVLSVLGVLNYAEHFTIMLCIYMWFIFINIIYFYLVFVFVLNQLLVLSVLTNTLNVFKFLKFKVFLSDIVYFTLLLFKFYSVV